MANHLIMPISLGTLQARNFFLLFSIGHGQTKEGTYNDGIVLYVLSFADSRKGLADLLVDHITKSFICAFPVQFKYS